MKFISELAFLNQPERLMWSSEYLIVSRATATSMASPSSLRLLRMVVRLSRMVLMDFTVMLSVMFCMVLSRFVGGVWVSLTHPTNNG